MLRVFAVCGSALYLCLASSSSPYPQDPADVPQDYICAWRKFAAEYTAFLRPDAVDEALAALQLPDLCNSSAFSVPSRGRSVPALPAASAASTIYVDGVNGNDANPGTLQAPLRTVSAGVQMARTRPPPAMVLLRAATYYLAETLELTPQDSGLTLSSYEGEEVWISGAAPIASPIAWQPFAISNSTLTVRSATDDCIYAPFPRGLPSLAGLSWDEQRAGLRQGRPGKRCLWLLAHALARGVRSDFRGDGECDIVHVARLDDRELGAPVLPAPRRRLEPLRRGWPHVRAQQPASERLLRRRRRAPDGRPRAARQRRSRAPGALP